MCWTKLGYSLLAALGPTGAVLICGILLILAAVATPTGPGREMGGSFAGLWFMFLTPIAMLITEIISTIIFLCAGVSVESFWWVTGIIGGLMLLPTILLCWNLLTE